MKYNAEDILHQSFEKTFRGYSPAQVQEFLQSMAREWDFFFSEVTTLQTTVAEQSDELKDLRRRERGLLDALNTAREVAQHIEQQAQERSAAILAEAQERADTLIAQAQRQQTRLMSENKELRLQRGRLDHELRSVLESHMRLLDEDVSEEDVSESPSLPTIHRRPRTDVPTVETVEEVDEVSHQTLVSVMPYSAEVS